MISTIFTFVLAALGLGFLIFIHELGHYLMARRSGMKVEVFSIGFGKPIRSWDVNGVRWQVGMIPFGGYVKIAGMEKKGSQEPYEIADGYYGKSPWKRIQVALMGPLFNIFFAFFAFFLIWIMGGRDIPFSEQTKYIGWVAKDSTFYQTGVRSGDEITSLNKKPYSGFKDFIFAAMTQKTPIPISGVEHLYWEERSAPFNYLFDPLKEINGPTFFLPATFLNYDRSPDFSLSQWSSLSKSGIEKGDRLICVDGELIFSKQQLIEVLNEPKTLLTIQRNGTTLFVRVPRVKISDIRMNANQKGEVDDWQHAAKLFKKVEELYFIPYNLTNDGVVEEPLVYLSETAEPITYDPQNTRSHFEIPLQAGDKIIGVDGVSVSDASTLLASIQTKRAQVIVKRDPLKKNSSFWSDAEKVFAEGYDVKAISELMLAYGKNDKAITQGSYLLLPPVTLIKASEIPYSDEMKEKIEEQIASRRAEIEKIKNAKERQAALKELEESQNILVLGGVFYDAKVKFNPSPFTLFGNAVSLTVKTITSLFSGDVSPKHLSGPVAIVSVMKQGITQGLGDGLYILGFISLNLAVFNLLPIPVLDGGHICFALYEMITRKRLSSKAMERLIIPFVVLLVLLFVYATYNDILRVIRGFF